MGLRDAARWFRPDRGKDRRRVRVFAFGIKPFVDTLSIGLWPALLILFVVIVAMEHAIGVHLTKR